MKQIDRKFFPDKSSEPDTIWQFLPCEEKIAYFQIIPFFSHIEQVFCGDINVQLHEYENSLSFLRAPFSYSDLYYTINRFNTVDSPEEFIYSQIDHGNIIGFNTDFTALRNFSWYNDDIHKNSPHYSIIVGYDHENYVITDAPNLITQSFYLANHTSLISKKILNKLFEKKCSFLTVSCDNCSFPRFNIVNLVEQIERTHHSLPIIKNSHIVWSGQYAFDRFILLIEEKDPRVSGINLFEGPFIATTISGRRELLRRCIFQYCRGFDFYTQAINILSEGAKKWETLANIVQKHKIKYGKYTPDLSVFKTLYKIESETVSILAKLCEEVKNERS